MKFLPLLTIGNLLRVAGYFFLLTGIFYSRASLSIGMLLLVADGIASEEKRTRLINGLKHPVNIGFILFFLMVVLSGVYTTDLVSYVERVRIKLPFLIVPVVLIMNPLSKNGFRLTLYLFLFLSFSACMYSLYFLVTDFEATVSGFGQGHVLQTPINHIRFSLLIALACCASLYLLKTDRPFSQTNLTLSMLSVFFFAFLHLLSVRSGLLAIYSILLFFVLYQIIRSGKAIWYGSLGAFIILSTLFIFLSPTLRAKFYYVRWDIQQTLNGKQHVAGSDSRRIQSIIAGVAVGNSSPVAGVGYGDVKAETSRQLSILFPELPDSYHLIPHNQFIFIYAGLGILGVIAFVYLLLSPFFRGYPLNDFFFFSAYVSSLSSFVSEATLENQIGTAYFVFFFCFSLSHYYARHHGSSDY